MASELLRRVGTAAVLVPALLAAVFMLETPALALVLGVLVLLAGMEWPRLAGWSRPAAGYLIAALLLAGMLLVGGPLAATGVPLALAALAIGWWLLALVLIVRFERGADSAPGGLAAGAVGLLVLLPTWSSLLLLHRHPAHGPFLLLGLFIIVWTADTGAYFAGRRWGRRRLAARVSPGKTQEGCYGALALVVGLTAGMALVGGLSPGRTVAITALAAVTVIFSIIGDLFESLMKRQRNLKDSGSLLPGHGGVLDRIDSLTAAAPVYALGLSAIAEAA